MAASLGRFSMPALPSSRLALFCASVAVVGLGAAAAWRWGRRRARRELVRVGAVSSLAIYPVKSCQGLPLESAELTKLGVRSGDLRDRFWLVIKEDGHMVTARQEPRLVLVSVNCENGLLILNAPEMKELTIPITAPKNNPVKTCRVFGLDIQGRDCGDEVAHWFTTFLKSEPYRLVHYETNMAPRKCEKIHKPFQPNDEVPYSDCAPLLIISDASMEDLNSRMEKKINMRHFRPNITVSGCGAYEEDTWGKVIIGDVELREVMACGRCLLTTVDPENGIIDRKEPLETLKSYRMCDPADKHLYKSAPLFGSFFTVSKLGTIKVGDPVYKIIEC
ncbi:mitochondrial amidoxime reducing component 2-like isoform X1 [Podarcis raffonei]|uniref:mitochondrial amidoxime reducing component 2-like isoform X1 n=1 Tax=Podarcis raffonei TaxID=65483 RepID=UPI0023295FBC|nr:mitochondrial amidoxime reducing component 2-like isoform X1 [Podarcis raffonei]